MEWWRLRYHRHKRSSRTEGLFRGSKTTAKPSGEPGSQIITPSVSDVSNQGPLGYTGIYALRPAVPFLDVSIEDSHVSTPADARPTHRDARRSEDIQRGMRRSHYDQPASHIHRPLAGG